MKQPPYCDGKLSVTSPLHPERIAALEETTETRVTLKKCAIWSLQSNLPLTLQGRINTLEFKEVFWCVLNFKPHSLSRKEDNPSVKDVICAGLLAIIIHFKSIKTYYFIFQRYCVPSVYINIGKHCGTMGADL